MTIADIEVLTLVVGAFSLFGGILAWATWDESRNSRRRNQ